MERYRPELWRVLCGDLSFHVVCACPFGNNFLFLTLYSHLISPGGLTETFLCGGVPPNVYEPESVYARTYGVYKESTGPFCCIANSSKKRLQRGTRPTMLNTPKMPPGLSRSSNTCKRTKSSCLLGHSRLREFSSLVSCLECMVSTAVYKMRYSCLTKNRWLG